MTFLCDFTRSTSASSFLSNVLLAFSQKAFHIECSSTFFREKKCIFIDHVMGSQLMNYTAGGIEYLGCNTIWQRSYNSD